MPDATPPPPNAAARALIERLGLRPHPEGGWYRETHRSPVSIGRAALPAGYPGDRSAVTCILFLLEAGASSRWHRVRSEELWLHHRGDPVRLGLRAGPPGSAGDPADREVVVGGDGELQAVVRPGEWQRAEPAPGGHGYTLVGCVVAPGFEFEDFELVAGP